MEKYLDNLDIYEVDKGDYEAYFYRLPKDVMKTTPQEGMVVYKDIVSGDYVCGILTENIMAMPANRYFIFNFFSKAIPSKVKTLLLTILDKLFIS